MEKGTFGQLTIAGVELEITCLDDYLQGFYIGKKLIAQFDGDAGDIWETQSTLFKDERYQLILKQVKYSTSSSLGMSENVAQQLNVKTNTDGTTPTVECK
ncbi:MAG: hypothetical protein HRT44_05380, partial [Bdellovibrionales bacterium]|nr:hypothetical protein [Bdellovibrionales bacterium]